MAGPLNGLGTGQQVPLANTFQPGQKDVRPEETNKQQQDNTVKTRGSDAASSQKSETGNQDATRASRTANNDVDASNKRGSLVDITV